MTPCRHKVCIAIADGTCHIDTDGWLFGVTREQQVRVRKALGQPTNELAVAIHEATEGGRELVRMMRETLANPSTSSRIRKMAEKQLERLRNAGIPKDAEVKP